MAIGCGQGTPVDRTSPPSAVAAPGALPETVFPTARTEVTAEAWFAHFIRGKRVGTRQWAIVREPGRDLQGVRITDQLQWKRFGGLFRQSMETVQWTDRDGRVVAFGYRLGIPDETYRFVAQRAADVWECDVHSGGRRRSFYWSATADGEGPLALEDSLQRRPLRLGDRRTVRVFVPLVDRFRNLELQAVRLERIEWPTPDEAAVERPLLRVDVRGVSEGPEEEPSTQLWVDERGQLYKRQEAALDQQTFRVSAAAARRPFPVAELDLGIDVGVPVPDPPRDLLEADRVEYDVQADGLALAEVFVQDARQRLELASPTSGTLRVRRVGRETPVASEPSEAAPGEDDLGANWLIQTEDPRVRAIARAAISGQRDPWGKAIALQRYIHRIIDKRDISQVFSSAAEVAARRAGDCSEHAVLLVAACRTQDIPARVAVGLVYSPADQRFVYHMWTEVYVDGRWLGLDATLGQGPVGAAHLKMFHSNLAHDTPYALVSRVVATVGKLQLAAVRIGGGKR